jgi:hypothetical protein
MSSDFSPTAPWPVVWSCDVSTESPTATGMAVGYASEVLWSLSGQRFGFTTVKLRPRHDYGMRDTPYPGGWMPWPGTVSGGPYYGGSYYGYWFDTSCGSIDCSCGNLKQVNLPAPAHAVTEVRVDGAPLVSGAYRLDNSRLLVRVDGGSWPVANDLTKADTVVGTWSITAQYGESIPSGAGLAIGELACEFLRGMSGQDCQLPRGVTQLARQGVTITLPDVSQYFDKGLTGLRFVDMFIRTWNPKGIRARAQAYSIDRGQRRRN